MVRSICLSTPSLISLIALPSAPDAAGAFRSNTPAQSLRPNRYGTGRLPTAGSVYFKIVRAGVRKAD